MVLVAGHAGRLSTSALLSRWALERNYHLALADWKFADLVRCFIAPNATLQQYTGPYSGLLAQFYWSMYMYPRSTFGDPLTFSV